MKASRKIIRKITISLLAVLIGNILGCHPAGIPSVEAASVTGVECTSDINCRPGQFCYAQGFHARKFCSPCQDCLKFNRLPNPDNECAKRRNECGPCLNGYVETHEGGICTINDESKDETAGNTEGEVKPHPWIVVGSVATVIIILLMLAGCAIWRESKRTELRPERLELELNRLAPSFMQGKREERYSIASAPLVPQLEYQQQPAFHTPTAPLSTPNTPPPAYRFESEIRNPRLRMENYNRANPFQAGYGAGDWAMEEVGGAENQNLEELEDMVDGNPPPGAVEPNALNSEQVMDPSVPLLENLPDEILLPQDFENDLNGLDQENIEEIINNEFDGLPQIDLVQSRQSPVALPAQENDLYFGIRINYALGLFREVDTPAEQQQQSDGFDPTATRADLSSLIASGPGSPESNDSGTNMEVEDHEYSEDESDHEDAELSVSREVPVMDRHTAHDSLLYEDDENSFDSMYEDAVGDNEELELVEVEDNA